MESSRTRKGWNSLSARAARVQAVALVEDRSINCSNKASLNHNWTRPSMLGPSMLGPSTCADVYSMLRVVAASLDASLEVIRHSEVIAPTHCQVQCHSACNFALLIFACDTGHEDWGQLAATNQFINRAGAAWMYMDVQWQAISSTYPNYRAARSAVHLSRNTTQYGPGSTSSCGRLSRNI